MATQKRNTSSRGRTQTTRKGNSGNNSKNKKGSQGPDVLTILVVLAAVVLVVILLSKYSKEKNNEETLQPTGTASVTGTSIPENPDEGEEAKGTDTPKTTQGASNPVTPEATQTPTPEPEEEKGLSLEEAKKIVEKIVELEKYSIELLDDHLMLEGEEYYTFCINDENGESMEPLLIVGKKEKTLYCYDMSGVVAPISRFPLDKTESGNAGETVLTQEEAKTMLSGYSAAALGTAKEVSAYEMTVDDWTTMVNGKECYGINLFESVDGKQRFRGTFYVALDGSAVYSKDEGSGEFLKREK